VLRRDFLAGDATMIRRVIQAAFLPPGSAAAAEDPSRFAVLPQQTEDQLLLSEVHTKLDQCLSFLQREIGYSLLADALPRPGGGVKLVVPPSVPKSAKLPKEQPGVSRDNTQQSNEVLVDREVIRYSPETAKYAHFPDDLVLVWRFVTMLAEISPDAGRKVRTEQLYKNVLQGVRLMHLCDYNYSDVVVTLAYASVYFHSIYGAIGHKMSEFEAAHVCVLLIYLAHSFLLDETCPLRCWQKYVFRKYCTLKVLDAALFRLFSMRKDYGLRVTPEQEKHALTVLLSTTECDVHIRAGRAAVENTFKADSTRDPESSSTVTSAGSTRSTPDSLNSGSGRKANEPRPPARKQESTHARRPNGQEHSLSGRRQGLQDSGPAVRPLVPA